jgi:hypothetical protein
MGETISSALFAAGRRAAEEPCARAALGQILRDEAMHAHRFWALLDALGDAHDKGQLHAVAARALGAIERTQIVPVLQRLARGAPFDPAWAALGVLPQPWRGGSCRSSTRVGSTARAHGTRGTAKAEAARRFSSNVENCHGHFWRLSALVCRYASRSTPPNRRLAAMRSQVRALLTGSTRAEDR